MIVTIGGTKGGGGKTTVAVNLAVMRSLAGKDVLLIDADDQGTASKFTSLRASKFDGAGYTCVRLLGEEIINAYDNIRRKYDDIVIDAGGRDTESFRAGLGIANIALIPYQPSSFDVWELATTGNVIKLVKPNNRKLKAYVFLNMADPVGQDNEDAAEVAGDVKEIKYIETPIVQRKAFKRAAAAGVGIVEQKGGAKDNKARLEIENVYKLAFNEEFEEYADLDRAGNE